jgi:uncharacterized protein (TIGR03083 family)
MELLQSLEADISVFTDVATSALAHHQSIRVPCCPGWDVRELVVHVGKFHSLVARWVTDGRRPDAWDSMPADHEDPVAWLRRCSARLLDAVGTVDPATPCSTWSPSDQSVGFWVRRMAHETAVHRVDLEQALGIDWRMDPDVAVDGIDEVLTLWLTGHMPPGLTGSGRTVRLRAYAPDGDTVVDRVIRPYRELVHFSPYERGQRVDAELSGPVEAVWAWCWGRLDTDDEAHPLVVEGDIGAVDELRGALAAAEQ